MSGRIFAFDGADCKIAVIMGNEGEGVLIPGVPFEDPSLPDDLQRKYLLPIRIRENTITEIAWRGIKRVLFSGSIRSFKNELESLITNEENAREFVELPLSTVRSLKIAPGLPLKGRQFKEVFFSNTKHMSTASLHYLNNDKQKKREFETCRGSVDLAQLMKTYGLGLTVSVKGFEFDDE